MAQAEAETILYVRTTKEQLARLDKMAAREDRSRASMVRKIIEHALDTDDAYRDDS